jgi:hypothetical protein
VGVKQAAATLSNLTFCITRNGNVLELGFLLASLQQIDGLVAPEHTFVPVTGETDAATDIGLDDQLAQLAQDYPTVYGQAFAMYGDGDVALG